MCKFYKFIVITVFNSIINTSYAIDISADHTNPGIGRVEESEWYFFTPDNTTRMIWTRGADTVDEKINMGPETCWEPKFDLSKSPPEGRNFTGYGRKITNGTITGSRPDNSTDCQEPAGPETGKCGSQIKTRGDGSSFYDNGWFFNYGANWSLEGFGILGNQEDCVPKQWRFNLRGTDPFHIFPSDLEAVNIQGKFNLLAAGGILSATSSSIGIITFRMGYKSRLGIQKEFIKINIKGNNVIVTGEPVKRILLFDDLMSIDSAEKINLLGKVSSLEEIQSLLQEDIKDDYSVDTPLYIAIIDEVNIPSIITTLDEGEKALLEVSASTSIKDADSEESLLVTLDNFKASLKQTNINLMWVTNSEEKNLGFNILRGVKTSTGGYEITPLKKENQIKQTNPELNENCSTQIQGQLEVDNSNQPPKLISAIGNSAESTCYSFTDNSNLSDGTYYYLLEDISDNGDSTFHCNHIDAVTVGQAPAIDLESAINYCKEVTGSNN